jgi:hypothetical protein
LPLTCLAVYSRLEPLSCRYSASLARSLSSDTAQPTPRNRFGAAAVGWSRSNIFSIASFTRCSQRQYSAGSGRNRSSYFSSLAVVWMWRCCFLVVQPDETRFIFVSLGLGGDLGIRSQILSVNGFAPFNSCCGVCPSSMSCPKTATSKFKNVFSKYNTHHLRNSENVKSLHGSKISLRHDSF